MYRFEEEKHEILQIFLPEKNEIYIPIKYFDPSMRLAQVMGDKISTFRCFYLKCF